MIAGWMAERKRAEAAEIEELRKEKNRCRARMLRTMDALKPLEEELEPFKRDLAVVSSAAMGFIKNHELWLQVGESVKQDFLGSVSKEMKRVDEAFSGLPYSGLRFFFSRYMRLRVLCLYTAKEKKQIDVSRIELAVYKDWWTKIHSRMTEFQTGLIQQCKDEVGKWTEDGLRQKMEEFIADRRRISRNERAQEEHIALVNSEAHHGKPPMFEPSPPLLPSNGYPSDDSLDPTLISTARQSKESEGREYASYSEDFDAAPSKDICVSSDIDYSIRLDSIIRPTNTNSPKMDGIRIKPEYFKDTGATVDPTHPILQAPQVIEIDEILENDINVDPKLSAQSAAVFQNKGNGIGEVDGAGPEEKVRVLEEVLQQAPEPQVTEVDMDEVYGCFDDPLQATLGNVADFTSGPAFVAAPSPPLVAPPTPAPLHTPKRTRSNSTDEDKPMRKRPTRSAALGLPSPSVVRFYQEVSKPSPAVSQAAKEFAKGNSTFGKEMEEYKRRAERDRAYTVEQRILRDMNRK